MSTETMQWFRLYAGIVDDEKLRLLAFEDRWHYVALLALKCDGILDKGLDRAMLNWQVAVKLGVQLRELEAVANRLEEVGLIDAETFQPLAWDRRQFKSDRSTVRVREFRERKKRAAEQVASHVTEGNVSVTPPDTETDTDTEEAWCVNAGASASGTFEGHGDTPTGTPTGIPATAEPQAPPTPSASPPGTPTPAGMAAAALNRAGCRVVSQNPNLVAAVREGVATELLLEVYAQFPDKPAGYVIATARRINAERAQPVQPSLIAGARHAAHHRSPPESAADRVRRIADEAEQRERASAAVIDGHAYAVGSHG